MSGRILVIDDEKTFREKIKKQLEEAGYEVFQAEDGPGALRKLTEGEIDLAILDLIMSPMHGLHTLEIIKRRHPDFPVILVTGYGTKSSQGEALRLGASHYIDKSTPLDKFVSLIENTLNNKISEGTHQGALLCERCQSKMVLDELRTPLEIDGRTLIWYACPQCDGHYVALPKEVE